MKRNILVLTDIKSIDGLNLTDTQMTRCIVMDSLTSQSDYNLSDFFGMWTIVNHRVPRLRSKKICDHNKAEDNCTSNTEIDRNPGNHPSFSIQSIWRFGVMLGSLCFSAISPPKKRFLFYLSLIPFNFKTQCHKFRIGDGFEKSSFFCKIRDGSLLPRISQGYTVCLIGNLSI